MNALTHKFQDKMAWNHNWYRCAFTEIKTLYLMHTCLYLLNQNHEEEQWFENLKPLWNIDQQWVNESMKKKK